MNRIVRLVLPIVIVAVVFFLLQHIVQLRPWLSIVIAVGAGVITILGEVLEFTKKPLEVMKLGQEIAKLQREAKKDRKLEQAEERLVKLPTADEIREYGVSHVERALRRRYKREQELEKLPPKPFIADSQEDRWKGGG
jgi:hypothetical protein